MPSFLAWQDEYDDDFETDLDDAGSDSKHRAGRRSDGGYFGMFLSAE